LREQAIALVPNWLAGNFMSFHLGDEGLYVVAHQVELVHVVLLRRVHRYFGWGQSEDQPSVAHIHIRELKHIAQKLAVNFSVLAINDRMCASDHDVYRGLTNILKMQDSSKALQ